MLKNEFTVNIYKSKKNVTVKANDNVADKYQISMFHSVQCKREILNTKPLAEGRDGISKRRRRQSVTSTHE